MEYMSDLSDKVLERFQSYSEQFSWRTYVRDVFIMLGHFALHITCMAMMLIKHRLSIWLRIIWNVLKTSTLQIGQAFSSHNGSANSLGVSYDKCVHINIDVTSVLRTPYYPLKNIHYLKQFSTQTFVTVVHVFVLSCINLCNTLWH